MEKDPNNESKIAEKPKIVSLGTSKNFLQPLNKNVIPKEFPGNDCHELVIIPTEQDFESNQNATTNMLDDGNMEITVNQEHSTPGIRSKQSIILPNTYNPSPVGLLAFINFLAGPFKLYLSPVFAVINVNSNNAAVSIIEVSKFKLLLFL